MDSKTVGKAALGAVGIVSLPADRPLQCLSIRDIYAIDDALAALEAFGEVRLIKKAGKLRFIRTLKSQVLKRSE